MKGSSHFKCKPHCLAFPDNCSKCVRCGRRPKPLSHQRHQHGLNQLQAKPGSHCCTFDISKNTFSSNIMLVDKSRNQLLHFLIWLHTQRVLVDSAASHMHSALVHCELEHYRALVHVRLQHLLMPTVYRQPEDRFLAGSQVRRR